MKESDLITPIIRAKLVKDENKSCAYFGKMMDGKKVFVKGPFLTEEEAKLNLEIENLKRKMFPDIATVNCRVKELIPDTLNDCEIGLRKKVQGNGKPYFFQISDNIFEEMHFLPCIVRKSYLWTRPTNVVDFDLINLMGRYTHINLAIFNQENFKAAREFATHFILSWILGTGSEMTCKNFIWDKTENRVYQVGQNKLFCTKWEFNKAFDGDKSMRDALQTFILSHWDSVFKDMFKNGGELFTKEVVCSRIFRSKVLHTNELDGNILGKFIKPRMIPELPKFLFGLKRPIRLPGVNEAKKLKTHNIKVSILKRRLEREYFAIVLQNDNVAKLGKIISFYDNVVNIQWYKFESSKVETPKKRWKWVPCSHVFQISNSSIVFTFVELTKNNTLPFEVLKEITKCNLSLI